VFISVISGKVFGCGSFTLYLRGESWLGVCRAVFISGKVLPLLLVLLITKY